MRLSKYCCPTPQQELLLKAAVLSGPKAIEAWHQWQTGLVWDSLDQESLRVLPLLFHNLRRQGVQDDLMARFRDVYRATWLSNHRLFHQLAKVLNNLARHKIKTMVLKGVAVALLYYRDWGLRPMGDVDILIEPENAGAALHVLMGSGLTPLATFAPETLLAEHLINFHNAVHLNNAKGCDVDLHWYVLNAELLPGSDQAFWGGALQISVLGAPTCAMNPTDLLLHICLHGFRYEIMDKRNLRWVADAMMIIKTSGPEIDWPRLLTEARKRRMVLPIRDALFYLQEKFEAPIPQTVMASLSRHPVTSRDRLAHRIKTTPLVGLVPSMFFRYWQLSHGKAGAGQLPGLLTYFKKRWSVKHTRALLFIAAAKLSTRLLNYFRAIR